MRQIEKEKLEESDLKLTGKRSLILVICAAGTALLPPPINVMFGLLTGFFLLRQLRFLVKEVQDLIDIRRDSDHGKKYF